MESTNAIKDVLLKKGADTVGFADISHVETTLEEKYDYAVVIGVSLEREIVKQILRGPTIQYFEEYKRVNELLNALAQKCSKLI